MNLNDIPVPLLGEATSSPFTLDDDTQKLPPLDAHVANPPFAATDATRVLPFIPFSEYIPSPHAVELVGKITNVRKIITKNNEQMAVITMQCGDSSETVVFFPRTWLATKDYFRANRPQNAEPIVGDTMQVIGTEDLQRGDKQIICELVLNFAEVGNVD